MTFLELVNRIVQILCFRIARITEPGEHDKYGVLFPVRPFTGWRENYRWRWKLYLKAPLVNYLFAIGAIIGILIGVIST